MKLKTIAMVVCSLICAGAAWTAVDFTAKNVPTVSAAEDTVDISAGATISGWQDSAELKQLTISFDKNALSDFNYSAMDTETYAYIQEYLYFDGKSVKEINADTSLGALGWKYTQFPGNADDKYKVPVLIYERDAARLRLFIHKNYFAMLGDHPTFELKEGLSFVNEGQTYVMEDTRRFTYNGSSWEAAKEEKDVTASVTVKGWDITGDAGELTYTRINLGEGVMPEGVGYGIIDADAWKYVQDYITINGRTVADINANVDDSAYVYSTFPSTMDAYKVPVMIYVNNGTLEVKVHNDYMASLGGNVDVIIEVKAGLSVKEGSTTYTVAKDVQTYVRRKQYTLAVEYAPGTENRYLLTMGSEITLVAPEKEHYTFVGWFEKDTEAVALTVMPESDYAIYAKYTAIEYTVTFKADGEQVGETQTYTVENKTISEPTAPAKEHYTVAWAAYELNGGNVVVEAVYTAIEYTVSFMDGETVVGTATYTIDNTEITEPAAPTKEGYTSAWASYELTGGDITVEVVYTLIDDSSSDDSSSDDSSSGDSSSDDSSSGGSSSDDNVSDSASSDENSTSNAGCFGTVSGLSASIAMLGLSMSVLLKKKENE